jgi:hypothetical protein
MYKLKKVTNEGSDTSIPAVIKETSTPASAIKIPTPIYRTQDKPTN